MKHTFSIFFLAWYLLVANTTFAFTHADTLRGSNGPGRNWWDVVHYNLSVNFGIYNKEVTGSDIITLQIVQAPVDSMQIDLQEPMLLDSAIIPAGNTKTGAVKAAITHEGNVWWLIYPFHKWKRGEKKAIELYYHGSPRVATNPPWNGGFIYSKDSLGKTWMAVACQGLGASCWWPCKDYQADEPDSGIDMHYQVPAGLQCIGNGRLLSQQKNGETDIWHWKVSSPINSYDVTFYIGDYIHWSDTLNGEKGNLTIDYYALSENEIRAREQFKVVKPMLHCFESWLGPYPFYQDGYKLVEAPYLGMEHQSAVAYGNKYRMGYLGRDRSNTGVGMAFDYIIVHESGHEWFGNNITAKDIADNWIHEGITTYTETLFANCLLGKEKANEFCRGEWGNIHNDKPIIGIYNVNEEGSGDMYDKGAAMMHMIHTMVGDATFKSLLRSLSKQFYHQTVTTQEVEQYISTFTGINFAPFFNQYLRTTNIPEIDYYIKDKQLFYRFKNVVENFSLPMEIAVGNQKTTLNITHTWQNIPWDNGYDISFSKDFLVKY